MNDLINSSDHKDSEEFFVCRIAFHISLLHRLYQPPIPAVPLPVRSSCIPLKEARNRPGISGDTPSGKNSRSQSGQDSNTTRADAVLSCMHGAIPVSYTHLDVYKRQAHNNTTVAGQVYHMTQGREVESGPALQHGNASVTVCLHKKRL